MGTTLDNGTYLPDEGERNCYEGLAGNWVALDNHLGSTNIHVTINDKQAWNSHVADTTIHVTSADKQAWNGKADASALTAHTGDTTIHVTSADKQAWNGKADASALTAHTGDATIHVTAEDKQTWDTVTTKANDADVVHKSGAETIAGLKTFSDTVTVPSINGINPGVLSMPNLSAGVDISGYITAGSKHNEYTPTVDGWISVILKSTSGATAVFIYQGDFANGYYGATTLPNQSEPIAMSCLPVKAGTVVNIDTKGSNSYVYAAKFFPCMGNV